MIHFEPEIDRSLFQETLQFAKRQVRSLIEEHPGFYPIYTMGGRWKHDGPAWTHWCDGFLPGLMWIFQRMQPEESLEKDYWIQKAIEYSLPLEPRQFDREVHDLGFIFLSTYYRWYQVTREPRLNDVLVQAGKTMALRFREKGAVPVLLRGRRVAVHRHHDERGGDLLCGARDQRPAAARHRDPARADDAAVPGAGRRLDGARGHFRPGDGRVRAAFDATGLPRRFVLVARPDVGDVRIRLMLRVHARSAVPADGAGVRGLLPDAHQRRRRSAMGFPGGRRGAQDARHVGGGNRARGR